MDTVHVYGVDLMSTKDLLSYFGDYAPTYVEWINDSSCNVCFADEFSSVRAIVGLGEVLAPTDTPDGQGGALHAPTPTVFCTVWYLANRVMLS